MTLNPRAVEEVGRLIRAYRFRIGNHWRPGTAKLLARIMSHRDAALYIEAAEKAGLHRFKFEGN